MDDFLGHIRVIVQRNKSLATIILVQHANFIRRCQTLLRCQATAGKSEDSPAISRSKTQTGTNHTCFMRTDVNNRIPLLVIQVSLIRRNISVHISTSGLLSAISRDACIRINFVHFYDRIHIIFLSLLESTKGLDYLFLHSSKYQSLFDLSFPYMEEKYLFSPQ